MAKTITSGVEVAPLNNDNGVFPTALYEFTLSTGKTFKAIGASAYLAFIEKGYTLEQWQGDFLQDFYKIKDLPFPWEKTDKEAKE